MLSPGEEDKTEDRWYFDIYWQDRFNTYLC